MILSPVPDNLAPDVNTHCGRFHLVEDGDDCAVITSKYGISLADLYDCPLPTALWARKTNEISSRFLNPDVDAQCINLWLNYNYCVQPVGDIKDYPGYGPGPTKTRPPFTPGPSTSIPREDPEPTDDPNLLIIPIANLTREDCWQ